jgi:hypothetical protein
MQQCQKQLIISKPSKSYQQLDAANAENTFFPFVFYNKSSAAKMLQKTHLLQSSICKQRISTNRDNSPSLFNQTFQRFLFEPMLPFTGQSVPHKDTTCLLNPAI